MNQKSPEKSPKTERVNVAFPAPMMERIGIIREQTGFDDAQIVRLATIKGLKLVEREIESQFASPASKNSQNVQMKYNKQ